MIKKINTYFFGEEELCLSDMIWFYGQYAVMGLVALLIIAVNLGL